MPPNIERRIALFIDFENLVTNTGITPSNFDLQPALDRLLEKGRIVFRRAYCDWSRFREAKQTLHDLGVELVDVPPSTRAGKNAADMRLVIDAIELCYAREHIDTYVIASGDSDFCPLAYKLRENNRTVIGLGVRDATSPLFVRACDEFIYLRPDGKHRHDKRDKHAGSQPKQKQVPEIAREVVTSLLASATSPLNPSLIKETIVRKEPDFDERDHGFSSFSRLLDALEKEGLLRMQQANNRQLYVLAPEAIPKSKAEPAAEEAEGKAAKAEPVPQPPDEGVLEAAPSAGKPSEKREAAAAETARGRAQPEKSAAAKPPAETVPSEEPPTEQTAVVEPPAEQAPAAEAAPVVKTAKRTARGGKGRTSRAAAKTASKQAPGEVAASNGEPAATTRTRRSARKTAAKSEAARK